MWPEIKRQRRRYIIYISFIKTERKIYLMDACTICKNTDKYEKIYLIKNVDIER